MNHGADRLYVSAVGDITGGRARQASRRASGRSARDGRSPARAGDTRFPGGVTVAFSDTPQSVILFGQPGVPWKNPDYYPAYVLNQILGGGGFTARLMTEVRERGLTYGVSTNLVNMDLADSWQARSPRRTTRQARR
ncbi:MAG: insulinase family protein [Paracoccaceae bacterium]